MLIHGKSFKHFIITIISNLKVMQTDGIFFNFIKKKKKKMIFMFSNALLTILFVNKS